MSQFTHKVSASAQLYDEPSPVPVQLDERTCVMRALHTQDESLLQEFFYSHTPETIRQRYGYNLTTMTYERAHMLVSASEKNDLALGIVEVVEGKERLLAVGRYCLDVSEQSAEIAFVVHEAHRRHGLASILLKHMMAIAQQRGLNRLWAVVSRSNQAMLKLFYKHGAENEGSSDTDEVCVAFNLADVE